jgi:anion-transporting  ArsA/GET3 family ATPase
MTNYEETRKLFESKNQIERFESGLEEACGVIMRQTDYSEEKSLEKLKEHDLNVVSVVHEYLGVKSVEKKDDRTTNQKVFGEFRKFLDDASNAHYKKQHAEQQRQEYISRLEAAKRIISDKNIAQKNAVLQKTQLYKIQEDVNYDVNDDEDTVNKD